VDWLMFRALDASISMAEYALALVSAVCADNSP
jgi:hypothetical protein